MKRKFLILLCLVTIMSFVFSSCDLAAGNNTDNTQDNTDDAATCEHTFSESWTSNSESHWHAATCNHSEQKSEVNYHSDADEDGKCDVCNYNVTHTHSFADDWSGDNEYHWHVATCSHTDTKGSYAKHVDENANGVCDVCDAEFETVVDDTYLALITQIVNSRGGVASSMVVAQSEVISLGKDGTSTSQSVGEYKFGTDSMYSKVTTTAYSSLTEVTASSYIEKWQEYINAESVFGVYSTDGGALALDGAADINTIMGYYFTVSTLASEYGAENVLYALYQLSQEDSASNFTWTVEDGVYAFVFDYLQINKDVAAGEDPNVNFYKLTVGFKHNKNYVLTDLAIRCECYTNSLEDERDHDYTYDSTTGQITMKPEGEYAADTYIFVVSQTAGDRTYVNENSMEKFIPADFDLFTDNTLSTKIEDEITINAGSVFKFQLANFAPAGTSISFAPDLFSISLVGDTEDFVIFNNAIDANIIGNIKSEGTYTLTVSIGNGNDKIITVHVVDNGGSANDNRVLISEEEVSLTGRMTWDNMNEENVFAFTAEISGNYTFVLPAECGAYDKKAYDETYGKENAISAFIDPFVAFGGDYKGGEFTVFIEEGVTYEFYLGSFITQTVTIGCYMDLV